MDIELKGYDFLFKIIVLGDHGVGKTTFLRNYMGDELRDKIYPTTIAVDYHSSFVNIYGKKIKLVFWDTAGHEKFRSITSSYYRTVHSVILMYDVTDRSTFDNVKKWIGELDKYCDHFPVTFLIGNKTDRNRNVSTDEGEDLKEELGFTDYFEVSSFKESREEISDKIISKIIETTFKYYANESNDQPPVELTEKTTKCCFL